MSPEPDEPIPGPKPVGPEYIFEPDYDRPNNVALTLGRFLADLVREPAHWFKANVVDAYKGPKYYYYHRKYPRVLPIDECYLDDYVCQYEANQEFVRTFLVDRATLDLLRHRRDNCYLWWTTKKGELWKPHEECKDLTDTYEREEINFFVKYGDLHNRSSVIHAYNKQKHRMIMERRKRLAEESS